jgi:hypothetical protein
MGVVTAVGSPMRLPRPDKLLYLVAGRRRAVSPVTDRPIRLECVFLGYEHPSNLATIPEGPTGHILALPPP